MNQDGIEFWEYIEKEIGFNYARLTAHGFTMLFRPNRSFASWYKYLHPWQKETIEPYLIAALSSQLKPWPDENYLDGLTQRFNLPHMKTRADGR